MVGCCYLVGRLGWVGSRLMVQLTLASQNMDNKANLKVLEIRLNWVSLKKLVFMYWISYLTVINVINITMVCCSTLISLLWLNI